MPAPNDLEDLGYGRGQLRSAPAQSIRRLDVLLGRPVDINRAYADHNQQMAYYLAYQRYISNPGAYPWAPLALHPDKSWHCKGMAVDSDDGPNYGGPLTRATWREYGWLFEVATEDWHGQYYTSLDKHYGEPASGGSVVPLPTPKPTTAGGRDMFLFNGVSVPSQYYIAAYNGRVLECRPTLGVERKALLAAIPQIPRVQMSDADMVELCRQGGYVYKKS